MSIGSDDRTRLVEDAESIAIVNEEFSRHPNALPPPYQLVAGHNSNPNRGYPAQNSVRNHQAPVTPPPTYYGFSHLQSATGQPTFPGGITTLPNGQPVYLLPVAALSPNSGQPLIIGPYGAPQTRPVRTQRSQHRNVRASSNVRLPEPCQDNDLCTNCCCGAITIIFAAMIIFAIATIAMSISNWQK